MVVVLPWLPAMAMPYFWRINSASSSPRGITGMARRRASTTSGLSGRTAELTTTALAPDDVFRFVTLIDQRAALGKAVGQRGKAEVGAADAVTQFQQDFGEAAHADAADADEVDGLGLEKHLPIVLFRLFSVCQCVRCGSIVNRPACRQVSGR